jgi:hypothetical protein
MRVPGPCRGGPGQSVRLLVRGGAGPGCGCHGLDARRMLEVRLRAIVLRRRSHRKRHPRVRRTGGLRPSDGGVPAVVGGERSCFVFPAYGRGYHIDSCLCAIYPRCPMASKTRAEAPNHSRGYAACIKRLTTLAMSTFETPPRAFDCRRRCTQTLTRLEVPRRVRTLLQTHKPRVPFGIWL